MDAGQAGARDQPGKALSLCVVVRRRRRRWLLLWLVVDLVVAFRHQLVLRCAVELVFMLRTRITMKAAALRPSGCSFCLQTEQQHSKLATSPNLLSLFHSISLIPFCLYVCLPGRLLN